MTAKPNGRRVVIVGGGIGGLASAGLLARAGYDVEVFEQLPTVGGRAGSWERDGFRFDTGPSWYLMPEVFDHFFRLMGTTAAEQLDLTLLDPGYRVFFEGEATPADHTDVLVGRERNLDVFEKLEPGSRTVMSKYLDSAARAYRLAVKYFLYSSFRRLGPILGIEVLTRLGTLTRLLTTPLWSFVSRFVRSNRARQILGYPAVFLGASPFEAPAMFHLMSHLDLADGVYYPHGGFHRLIEAIRDLAVEAGAVIHTDATVTGIDVDRGGRPRVTGVTWTDAEGTEHRTEADLVVSAADLHHTETRLVPVGLQTFPEKWWDNATPSPGAVLLYLGVRGELPQLLHHSLFFTEDWHDNFDRIFGANPSVPESASFYVCTPSTTDNTVAPMGDSNVFVLVPVPADVTIGRGGIDGDGDPEVERIADRTIDAIATWAGIPDLRDRIVVRRTVGPADFHNDLNAWRGNALGPAHTLRQSAVFRARNQSRKIDGLYYVGSGTIPGIGLPMCLISAEVLLKTLRGDTSAGPLPDASIAP